MRRAEPLVGLQDDGAAMIALEGIAHGWPRGVDGLIEKGLLDRDQQVVGRRCELRCGGRSAVNGLMDMQHRVGQAPVVQCPGCHQPMEPKDRSSVTDRLVDIRYVCPACGMETKRTVKEEA